MRKVFLCLILLMVLACQTVSTTPTMGMTPSASAIPTETNQPTKTRTPSLTPFDASPTAGSESATSSPIPPTQTETPTLLPTFTPDPLEATPTRIAGQTPTGVEVTPLGGGTCRGYPCYHNADIDYVVVRSGGVNVRNGPGTEYTRIGFRVYGEVFHVGCLVQVSGIDWWAGTEDCFSPDMRNNSYTAVIVDNVEYTRALVGPAGR